MWAMRAISKQSTIVDPSVWNRVKVVAHKGCLGKNCSTPTGILKSLEALCIAARPWVRQGLGREHTSKGMLYEGVLGFSFILRSFLNLDSGDRCHHMAQRHPLPCRWVNRYPRVTHDVVAWVRLSGRETQNHGSVLCHMIYVI